METEVKEEIKFTPVGAGILVEWKQSESKLSLPPEVLKDIEMAENGIVKVVEVGPEVKQIKPNDYVLLNAAGRLINLNGKMYGLIKQFQIDGVYSSKPEFTKIEAPSTLHTIKTDKVEKQIVNMNKKYDIN